MAEDKKHEKVPDEKLRDIAGGAGMQNSIRHSAGGWTCQACGRPNLDIDQTCEVCGQSRDGAVEDTTEEFFRENMS